MFELSAKLFFPFFSLHLSFSRVLAFFPLFSLSFRTVIPETTTVFFWFLQTLPESLDKLQHLFHYFSRDRCIRGVVLTSSDMTFHTRRCCAKDRFYSNSRSHSIFKFPSFNIFHSRDTDNEYPLSVVSTTFILWRITCIVISIWLFFPVSAWLLLWDGVLLRWLPSLRTIFICSPDAISPSFVLTDSAVFTFFSGWMFSKSWFELISLFSSFYLIQVFSKRFILVLFFRFLM